MVDIEAEPDAARHTVVAVLARPVVASIVLLIVYAALSLFMDPDGTLGTDTGAKVATLDQMVEDGTLHPAVGYWAERWDPEGRFHPLLDSLRNDRGEWINVTTLPMLVAAYPLYAAGGYSLALLLPMLGGVGAALACRDLARQLGDERAGTRAFWIVGLASPMVIYSLDLWEHSLGAALMIAGTSCLVRTLRGDRSLRWPLLAGGALGAAATMRTEAFVVTLVVVAVTCVAHARVSVVRAICVGAATVAGFAVPWAGNLFLEQALGGNSRATRVSGAAQREFWTEFADRREEALITWFSIPGFGKTGGIVVGAVIVTLLAAAGVLWRRGDGRAGRIALIACGCLYFIGLVSAGPGFVSGALIAAPVAVAACWIRPSSPAATVVVMALSATLVTWMFQYLGGAGPQWGGRYILAPTLLLVTVGAVNLGSVPAVPARAVVGFALLVSAFGLLWLHDRTTGVDEFFEALNRQPEDVVIVTNGFLVREAGAAYADRLYLSLDRDQDLGGAVEVVRQAGHDSFAVLTSARELPSIEATAAEVDRIEFLGSPQWYHRFEFEP